jgi:1-acyl-sn-glycerol-3-phosphate acyltransferase
MRTTPDCGDIVWWDMLFGTCGSPTRPEGRCAFVPAEEERLGTRLAVRDAHADREIGTNRRASSQRGHPSASARAELPAMHQPNQFDLLRERRFAPFFWTQFLGAGNDNVFKNAFVVFVTFEAAAAVSLDAGTIVNLIGAVFIAPFMLFSATAGQLADKLEKSRLIRWIKLFEIAIMVVGALGFWEQSVPLLFAALALLGIHSTLFGPVKYAILPQHLRPEELIGGNGLVEMGTFVAILLGTIAGGLVVAIKPFGLAAASALILVIAVLGWHASRAIPETPAVAPDLRINWNPISETWRNLRIGHENVVVWRSMLGISWFWFYGAVYLAQLPAFTRDVLGGGEHVFTLLLAVFSIGIGAGSLLCERMSGRKVELGLVPFGSIGLTLFAVDLWLGSRQLVPQTDPGVTAFLVQAAHWRVLVDVLLLGAFGGFYTVPLYALIQSRSAPSHRSRIIAANNIMNALFMVASAGIAIGLLKAGLSIPELFLVVALLNAAVAVYIYALVPEFLMRFLAWLLVHTFYRVEKEGLERIPEEGACVLVCNHVSYVDAVVIAACVRRPVRFVMDHRIFANPLLSFIFRTMRTIPIAPAKEDAAMKERAFADVAEALRNGEIIGIFPEGKLTDTGELNPFRPGIRQIIDTTPVPVVPLALRGLWGSFFSRCTNGRAMRRWRGMFSRIALVAAAPVPPREVSLEGLQATVLALRGERR